MRLRRRWATAAIACWGHFPCLSLRSYTSCRWSSDLDEHAYSLVGQTRLARNLFIHGRSPSRGGSLFSGAEPQGAVAPPPARSSESIPTVHRRVTSLYKGAIVTVSTAPPEGSVTVCWDQLGPESAKSFPGQELVQALPDPDGHRPAERAKQEVADGRRGKG